MTQADLDAMPDVTPKYGTRMEVIAGVQCCVTVVKSGDAGPLWQNEDDALFVRDARGECWTTGWIGDKHVKRRVR